MNIPKALFWIQSVKYVLPLQEILKFWCALQSVLIWDVSLFLIWELTTDGSVSVTDQYMINTEEYVKVLLYWTYHTLITLCTKMELYFVSKKWSSQDNLQFVSGHDKHNEYIYLYTISSHLFWENIYKIR